MEMMCYSNRIMGYAGIKVNPLMLLDLQKLIANGYMNTMELVRVDADVSQDSVTFNYDYSCLVDFLRRNLWGCSQSWRESGALVASDIPRIWYVNLLHALSYVAEAVSHDWFETLDIRLKEICGVEFGLDSYAAYEFYRAEFMKYLVCDSQRDVDFAQSYTAGSIGNLDQLERSYGADLAGMHFFYPMWFVTSFCMHFEDCLVKSGVMVSDWWLSDGDFLVRVKYLDGRENRAGVKSLGSMYGRFASIVKRSFIAPYRDRGSSSGVSKSLEYVWDFDFVPICSVEIKKSV